MAARCQSPASAARHARPRPARAIPDRSPLRRLIRRAASKLDRAPPGSLSWCSTQPMLIDRSMLSSPLARTAPVSRRQTMRAIVQDTYGAADVWRVEEIARPEIAGNEVLVKVHAAGLDRGTWHLMAGQPYLMRLMGYGLRTPKNRVPGLDVAGTVVAACAEVTRFAAGDEVFGISRGSFAEYACAREDKLARKPADLTFGQAAAVAVSGLTALQGLRDAGRLRPGQHVLIIGASGGVGTFAVQIAKAFGAQVTGVCSTAKTGLVASVGADHVIDYSHDDFAAEI